MSNGNTPFFSNKVQEVIVSQDGTISMSSDTIFQLDKQSNIFEFHPFFESLKGELIRGEKLNLAFPCVQLDQDGNEIICDITIKKERDFFAFLIFDYTAHYKHLLEAAQEKKTALLNEHEHVLNKKHKEEQKEHLSLIVESLDDKIIAQLEAIINSLNELKSTSLDQSQKNKPEDLNQKVEELHLKALQIKEGIDIDFD